MIGQTVSHYKITEKLGEGGMGVVYKARDTNLDRDVALKFLPESLTPTKENKQRFIREAKAAAKLSHPNICMIHNINEYEGRQFIVMEYIDGETLREKIDGGDLKLETALEFAIRIAGALGKAHQNDIIHRDIKPENIMIDEDGRIKVMDFGLAKLKQGRDITKTGDTVGTLAYSSPEQIRGQKVDHRSDLFSLGILLYEMLTGQKPFQGEHQAAMTYSIVNEEPEPIGNYLSEVPEGLDEIIRRSLAKDPEDRHESAGELLSDLQRKEVSSTLGNEEVPEETMHSGTVQFWSSRKRLIGTSAVVIVVITLLSAWLLFDGGSQNKTSDNISADKRAETTKKSVAVLPFEDFSQEGNQQWFSDGLTEEILNSLSKLPELRVPARTSSFIFRDSKLPIKEIADSLQVNHIVEGYVRRSGNKMRISVQLIEADIGNHLWSHTYEVSTDSVFKVQEDVAEQIASALDVYLDEEKRNRMFAFGTRNVNAYEAYLKGTQIYWEAHNPMNSRLLWKANQWFEKAYRQDSSFAAAYYYHHDAFAHYLIEDQEYIDTLEPRKAYKQMHEDLNKAIEYSDNEGQLLLYRFDKTFLSKNWEDIPELVSQINESEEAKIFYATSRGGGWLSTVLPAMGYAKLAYQMTSRAIEQDPLNNLLNASSAKALAALGEKEKAIEKLNEGFLEVLLLADIGKQKKADSLLARKLKTSPNSAIQWFSSVPLQATSKELKSGGPGIDSADVANLLSLYYSVEKIAEGDSIAHKIDTGKYNLGSQQLVIFISNIGSIVTFELDSTPNLSERFQEADITLKPYDLFDYEADKIVQKELE